MSKAVVSGLVVLAAAAVVFVVTVPFRDQAPARPATVSEERSEPEPAPAENAHPAAPSEAAEPAPEVAGVVLGPYGEPEPYVRLTLHRVEKPWPDLETHELESALSGSDGRFEFDTPRGPRLMVVAEKQGLARAEVTTSPIDPEVVVHMTHGFTVEGEVQSPFDRRMADCLVLLEPSALGARRAISTRTDASGRFAFRDVPAGPARLTARHPDFQPATLPSIAVGSRRGFPLRFPSARPVVLRGRVTAAATAGPIADAVVRAYPSAWNSRLFLPVEGETEADGSFVLRGLGPGNVRLEVRHPRWSTTERLLSVSHGSPEPVAVELVPRCDVQGRLTGPETAGIELELRQVGETPVRTVTDEDGRFEFPGRHSAGKAELALIDDAWCFALSGSRTAQWQVDDSASTMLELELAPASVLRGRVVDADGEPVPDVRVLWREPSDGPMAPFSLLAVTGEDGGYEVRGLGRSTVMPGPLGLSTFVFRRRGWATEMLSFAGAAPGQTRRLEDVTLVRPATIEGRVTRRGEGVAGAVVYAGKGMHTLHGEVSGPDGRVTFHDLSPGRYRLKVRHAALPVVVSPEVVVSAGETVGPVELRLPAGRTIRGHVVDPFGNPVANALVVVRGHRTLAVYGDASGEFAIEVPDEDVELQVFADLELHQLNVQATKSVPRSRSEVEVELPMVGSGTVVARVLGLPGRRPPPGALIRLRSLDPPSGDPMRERQRNVASRWVETVGGRLRIERFPAGRTELVVHGQGWVPWVTEVDLAAGGEVDLGEVLLEPGASVRGVVVDEAGEPVPNAWVHLGDPRDRIPSGAVPASSFTDAEGRFELRGVGKRASELIVSVDGYAIRRQPLRVPDDLLPGRELRVVLDRGTMIEVRLQIDDADDGALTTIVLSQRGDLIDFVYLDGGSARFPHCGPGTYEVSVLGEPDATRTVEVEPDGPERVVVPISPPALER